MLVEGRSVKVMLKIESPACRSGSNGDMEEAEIAIPCSIIFACVVAAQSCQDRLERLEWLGSGRRKRE